MDRLPLFPFALAGIIGMVSLAWHVAVIYFVYQIWQKVKNLPNV